MIYSYVSHPSKNFLKGKKTKKRINNQAMQKWTRNIKQKPYQTDLEIKQIALAAILNWAMAQLKNKTPHEEITKGIEERLAIGLAKSASSNAGSR